jgi:leucyl-tRNA synthetase
VANFILMEYGKSDLRLSRARPADLDFVNKYHLGNVPVVCLARQDPRASSLPTWLMMATA